MKKLLITAFVTFLAISVSVNAQEIKSLTISPEEAEISVGDSVQFVATVIDTADVVVYTSVAWEIFSLEDVGAVDDTGLFTAVNAGRGIVIASSGEFADSSFVTVEEEEPAEPVEGAEIVSVTISEESIETNVGRTVQLSAVVLDSDNDEVDTTVTWELTSILEIGTIDEDGLFTATAEGAGLISASVGDISDNIAVTVAEAREQVAASIEIKPGRHTITAGDSIEFKAEILDEDGEEMEGDVVWSLSDLTIATIREDGLFTALVEGELTVIATFGDITGDADVTITNETIDNPVRNNIQVRRQNREGNTTKFGSGKAVEGDIIKISGIPNPFNFMNGTRIYFPEGSMNEDITITVKIPKIGKIKISETNPLESEVEFPDSILAGVSFEVSVNDIVVHPYYFDPPLEVTIPYREALLEKLGITPEDIGMFFITETGELVEEGITDITLDAENKLIRGVVAHFSDIVLAQKPAAPVSVNNDMPDGFSLSTNYPNPFNPTTTISFSTAELSNVNVTIYNMLGQHVKTLVSEIKSAGTYSVVWNGTNESGVAVTSGLYFYRFKAGNFSETKKLMLMK
ncbi:Ig-like domain-containing protein [Candidatus Latescibacterota bacterium]